jgi:tetratricopeptide (TPR) repeat protein
MELQLSYNPQTRHQTNAAFLRGNSTEQWFREINNWQIPLKGLTCFLLPEHKNAMAPGGLLVIFSDQVPAEGKILHPYAAINGNLFIPVDANLTPALTPAEMRELLIWHVQVFHPAIGFIGFDKEDEQPLDSFLLPAQAVEKSWDHAHPGMPPVAYLHTISVAMPAGLELTDLLNNGQITLPLSELPGKRPRRSLFMRFIDWMVRWFLRFLLAMFNIVAFLLRRAPAKPVGAGNTRSGKPGAGKTAVRASRTDKPETGPAGGLREMLRNWIEKTLGSIEERRDSELDRLLKMFDNDGDEALKFAIPIGDNPAPAASRGIAPQSARLSRQDTNFNLGKLFESKPMDTWSSAESYTTLLSRKYEQQAAKAIAEGDHRKAAYIYAHLLRNLHRAAVVLEEGKFYHEAAALYMDSLGQPLKAAECFEKGGLLLDAINIYKKLEKYEKTGDLYKQLSQEKPAQQYFQLAVDAAMQQKNHLEAARILQHKSGKPEEACAVLLDGWQHGNQDKDCLSQYLLCAEELDKDSFPAKMRMVYEQKTPAHKKDNLIEALLAFKKNMNQAAQDTAMEIAYEVISPQITAGREDRLAVLKRMLPEDKELSADIYRYSARQRQAKPAS